MMAKIKVYKCDNGKFYKPKERTCLLCAHCTDIFYDYTHGPYTAICELGREIEYPCDDFEEDKEDPNIIEVEE